MRPESAWLALGIAFGVGIGAASAQSPTIIVLDPDEVFVAGASTMTVTGTGFVAPVLGPTPSPGSVARLVSIAGAYPPLVLPTTFVSTTELLVTLPPSGSTRGAVTTTAMLGQLTEQGITTFLDSTGGYFCSFADVCPLPVPPPDVDDAPGIWRYVETAYRLGYGVTCPSNDGQRRFCPNANADPVSAPRVLDVTVVNQTLPVPLPPAPLPSNTLVLTVAPGETETTLDSDTPDPSVRGAGVTVTFSVVALPPTPGPPTGDVTVTDGVDECTATVTEGSCVITLTTIGTRTLIATYGGDATHAGSSSEGVQHVVTAEIAVPTLSEIGLLLFGLAIAGVALRRIRS